jgi:hypothetical protein
VGETSAKEAAALEGTGAQRARSGHDPQASRRRHDGSAAPERPRFGKARRAEALRQLRASPDLRFVTPPPWRGRTTYRAYRASADFIFVLQHDTGTGLVELWAYDHPDDSAPAVGSFDPSVEEPGLGRPAGLLYQGPVDDAPWSGTRRVPGGSADA